MEFVPTQQNQARNASQPIIDWTLNHAAKFFPGQHSFAQLVTLANEKQAAHGEAGPLRVQLEILKALNGISK